MLIKFTQKFLRASHFCRISACNNSEVSVLCRLFSNDNDLSQHSSPDQSFLPEKHECIAEEVTQITEYKTKLLKIAILGNPNAGKSTLVNRIVNRSVFACSKKVHTTRRLARAILNEGDTQIIVLDSPGLVTATESRKFQLETSFKTDAEKCLREADIIGVLHDVSIRATKNKLGPKVLRILHLYPDKHYILILNKIDLIRNKRQLLDLTDVLTNKTAAGKRREEAARRRKEEESQRLSETAVMKLIEKQTGYSNFQEIFMISALDGDGVEDLRNYLLSQAKPRKWIFPSEVFTDKNPETLIQESVRSHLLEYLPNEIPYGLDVELEYLEMTPEGTIVAVVLIKCETPRIEKLVKGNGGGRIKLIARNVEQALANTFYTVTKVKLVVASKKPIEDGKKKDTISL